MNELIDPKLYDELRGIAAKYMRGERSSHTLQPTALVNEAYLRIAKQAAPRSRSNRGQMLGYRSACDAPRSWSITRAARGR